MKGEAYIYKVDGTIEHREYDAMPPLEELRAAVGDGPIEHVPYWDHFKGKECVVFCNEHGIQEGLRYNENATVEWYRISPFMRKYDYLKGDVIILMGDRDFMRAI